MSLTRKRLVRLLPRNYFSDAQTCAPTSSAVVGTSADGVTEVTAGGGERSHAAGNVPDAKVAQMLKCARVISGRAQL